MMDADAVAQRANESGRARRLAAARLSRQLATESDLPTLLGVAKHGLADLFEGECTIQLAVRGGADEMEWLPSEGLRDEVALGLSEGSALDVVEPRAGILLAPQSDMGTCRAWVQFVQPRRVPVDEWIVGDLFAQAFAIAVDRLTAEEDAATTEQHLRRAIEAHRLIGQATGIMMERHRLTAPMAFELLRVASQSRNVKLRELARRVVDSGLEPDLA